MHAIDEMTLKPNIVRNVQLRPLGRDEPFLGWILKPFLPLIQYSTVPRSMSFLTTIAEIVNISLRICHVHQQSLVQESCQGCGIAEHFIPIPRQSRSSAVNTPVQLMVQDGVFFSNSTAKSSRRSIAYILQGPPSLSGTASG